MDHKLRAISNNVDDNDTVNFYRKSSNNEATTSSSNNSKIQEHLCDKNVPVLFTTLNGIHLRKFMKNSPTQYQTSFCDLERWVS
jgi:hypothetical protein